MLVLMSKNKLHKFKHQKLHDFSEVFFVPVLSVILVTS